MKTKMGLRKITLLILAMLVAAPPAWAEALHYLQIGTGPPGETHFQLGALISSAISSPPGLRTCGKGGSCGVPGLISMASASKGSVFNVQEIAAHRLDAAVVQADIALMAYQGKGPFDGQPIRSLRSIARIGSDLLQVVVRQGGRIKTLRDLKGKRVSLGEKGSGTLVHARMLLAALGLSEADLKIETMRSVEAADAMAAGKLDAFIVFDAAPCPAVAELAGTMPIALLPLDKSVVEVLRKADPLLHDDEVPQGSYTGQDNALDTVSVAVSLVASDRLSDDLAEGITGSLWSPSTQQLLRDGGVVPGRDPATLGTALNGLALPLHPGAAKFYVSKGAIE
jgi:TRAP transporter TAXI family solute receptor